MSDLGSRKPLYLQNPELYKAMAEGKKQENSDSYETFRPNVIHGVNYHEMEDRAGKDTHTPIRRYPNGQLDYDALVRHIVNVIHELEFSTPLTPVEMAILTVIFPTKYKLMEPGQAAVYAQLSPKEKARLGDLVEAKIKEEDNFSAGAGGGSVPGRSRTLS